MVRCATYLAAMAGGHRNSRAMAADVAHGVDLRSGRNCADRRGVVGFAEIKDQGPRQSSCVRTFGQYCTT
jgi:hypothetical protein